MVSDADRRATEATATLLVFVPGPLAGLCLSVGVGVLAGAGWGWLCAAAAIVAGALPAARLLLRSARDGKESDE